MSDEKPDFRDLQVMLNELTWAEVMKMAVGLGVDYSELRKIEEKRSDIGLRLLDAMNLWLTTDSRATWGRVVKALRDIKKILLAEKIEDKYCRPAATPLATTSSTASSVSPEAKGIAMIECTYVVVVCNVYLRAQ